jgi:hypothetical protein
MTVLPERGNDHMIDYSPLWETMQKKNISQYYLVNNGIDYRTMDQLRKNKNITATVVHHPFPKFPTGEMQVSAWKII